MVKADPLPDALLEAARDVATVLGIRPDWLDARPTAFLDSGLQAGFEDRLETKEFGPLKVRLASRVDQIHFKLYAATDHLPATRHLDDLIALDPSRQELLDAANWARTQDPSAGFRGELVTLLTRMGIADAVKLV